MTIEFRTIALCRHDYARLKAIAPDTYCRWLASQGQSLVGGNDRSTVYDYVDPTGENWGDRDFFFIVWKTSNTEQNEVINADVAKMLAIWNPGDVAENLETAIAELEALEATQ